jgi:hypothetical protein
VPGLDLPGPVDLDLEDQVLAGRQLLGRGRAVVLVEEAGPLDEPAGRDGSKSASSTKR